MLYTYFSWLLKVSLNNGAKFWSTNQNFLRVYSNYFHYQRNIIPIAILCMYYSQYSFDTLFVSLRKNSWLIGIMKFGFRMKLAWNNLIGFFAKGSVFHGYFCPFLAEKNSFNRIFLRGLVIFSDKSSKDVVHNTLPDMIASE